VTVSTRADARRSIDAILHAARDVLADDSASGINEVAAGAGLHRATVYRHFPSREALIERLYDAYLDDATAAIAEADPDADDLPAEIEALVRRVYEVNIDWRPYAWAPLYARSANHRRAELAAVLSGVFRKAQDAGHLRADLSIRMLLTTWGAPVQFYVSRIVEGEFTLDEVVNHTLLLLTQPA
jgi:TetR/AcrR family transcriptional regulator, mexCD-oprJ operon repressor